MFLHVERGSSVPISRQIIEQVRSQCLSGVLAAGTKLPSVRELAQQLTVNVNTVFRVYERLAAEGLIELRHGDGTYVTHRQGQTHTQLKVQQEKFQREFEALIQQGAMLGFTASKLRSMLSAAFTAAKKSQE